jgi:hypothetical protein
VEDIEAVFDQDPKHVCILQGPVAAKHSKIKHETIKDLQGNINSSLINKLLECVYGGDTSEIPTIDYLSPQLETLPQLTGIGRIVGRDSVTYTLGDNLPDVSSWLETLAGPNLNWLGALLTSVTIVQGTSYINNPIRRLLVPRQGQKVVVLRTSVNVYGAARSYGPHNDGFKAVDIFYLSSTIPISNFIDVTHRLINSCSWILTKRRRLLHPISYVYERSLPQWSTLTPPPACRFHPMQCTHNCLTIHFFFTFSFLSYALLTTSGVYPLYYPLSVMGYITNLSEYLY